eukprot:CAMPEP_0168389144 /NCGR_PEP_ID=MMETSP0228-20121227/16813_1 /TAXON_ID=133427 /ORGANISM="Protoceratium reticulatum, Strain CCCM 535 (=CCMP 1889)" /LENGTH=46 /DNA_ID= /DNA_START= /DNA_END= /DNA_ORIENTATION=
MAAIAPGFSFVALPPVSVRPRTAREAPGSSSLPALGASGPSAPCPD